MKSVLLQLKLPLKYQEGLFEYQEGLDNIPEWPALQKKGYTWDEHLKFNKLVSIEAMKYRLIEDKEDGNITSDEIKIIEEIIDQAIKEYNEM